MNWPKRASESILPLSSQGLILTEALKEWRYAGNCYDLEAPSEICELCDHPDIRYQFEICNVNTGNTLLVGSECINKFKIVAIDELGQKLDDAGTKIKVNSDRRGLIESARKRRVIDSLVRLSNKDAEFNITSFIDYLQRRGAFTPNQLATILWRLDKYQIPHNPSDFKLTIRRGREKEQLLSIPSFKLERIAACLYSSQKKFLESQIDEK